MGPVACRGSGTPPEPRWLLLTIPLERLEVRVPTEDRFDMVVIGSGPAGEKAAAQAAYFDKRVAVVERSPSPCGAVVRNAVIPSKTLRETALHITGFRWREVYGLGLTLDPEATVTQLRTSWGGACRTRKLGIRGNRTANESLLRTWPFGPAAASDRRKG
jgi:FAD binding domain